MPPEVRYFLGALYVKDEPDYMQGKGTFLSININFC